ncbi:iron permease FTR1 [Macrolepiota fuliginosa MF-IS2]|uniref:Iron permease FTR1 n=1 Tax=Macrolepiota fuliginosa MF-IS2 TaxID=1400762 RepID=A0A9P6C1L9_9AGAR|nr:iron permease FTR1 [Macrolepiota fuliginosa MF-IS2]
MGKNLFSVPIFFIVFRETLEAAIIVSVLLGLVQQLIVDEDKTPRSTGPTETSDADSKNGSVSQSRSASGLVEDDTIQRRRLLRKMRLQIFLGAGLGLFVALSIGAAFIAVWFTRASNLWAKSEELWEGVFNLIASLMIFVMGISMLKLDRAKVKWRVKLSKAFSGNQVDKETATGKWVLFILPFVTVMREGLEAVVFVGGVSLGQPAASIPIAAIVGIVCGLVCGFLIYQFASRTALTVFLVVMTNFLLLIGAGLFSKAVGNFQEHAYNALLGGDADDAGGTGPGSYLVQGNVWHLDCCGTQAANGGGGGWSIFAAIFGWSNNGSLGTILSYVFYWIAVMGALIFLKFKEGRTTLLGRESAAGQRRKEIRAQHNHEKEETQVGISELPK